MLPKQKYLRFFKISRQTFGVWLKDYHQNNSLEEKIEKLYHIRLNKNMLTLKKNLSKNKEYSISIIWSKMKLKYPDFEISKGHLTEVIRDNNITRKRTTRRHYPNKT